MESCFVYGERKLFYYHIVKEHGGFRDYCGIEGSVSNW